jgi:PIN domain nuclease of toxin-antitoxin system
LRLLLDTHAFFWFIDGSDRMPPSVAAAIEASGGSVYVSMATLWEMAIKVGLGRWPEAADIVAEFEYLMAAGHFQTLAILPPHIRLAACIESAHRDPFDRLLAAQARVEGLILVTTDPAFATLGAATLW